MLVLGYQFESVKQIKSVYENGDLYFSVKVNCNVKRFKMLTMSPAINCNFSKVKILCLKTA